MKAYIWAKVIMLGDWGPGLAIGVAESKEQAIEQAVEWYKVRGGYPDDPRTYPPSEQSLDILRDELHRTEPEVHLLPMGLVVYGSS